jgi:hypothetical protein
MSVQVQQIGADAAAGAMALLPLRKRKAEEVEGESELLPPLTGDTTEAASAPPADELDMSPKGRALRLEQNRKAARESRKRKKVMIEELQRSVIFFSRANGALKQQNDDLTRLLMQAQTHIGSMDEGSQEGQANASVSAESGEEQKAAALEQTQAVAGHAAAQTVSVTAPSGSSTALPAMQPGATMQAMANFQQAAAVAMQAAIQGMQGIPGVNMSQLAASPVGANAQQAYTDTMTALSMQQAAQAAAAAGGQQYAVQSGLSFMSHPLLAWQQQSTSEAQNVDL